MPATFIATPSVPKKRASKAEIRPSALRNTSHASLGPERQKSLPIPGRKAHLEQDHQLAQLDQDGQSRTTERGSKSMDERPLLDKVSEEPDVMFDDNDIPHHQRVDCSPESPVLPRPHQRHSRPLPPDPVNHSREASPRPQSRNLTLKGPRSRLINGSMIMGAWWLNLSISRRGFRPCCVRRRVRRGRKYSPD